MSGTFPHLAQVIRVPDQRINELVNGRRGITPITALRRAKDFGMSADLWMHLQLCWVSEDKELKYEPG